MITPFAAHSINEGISVKGEEKAYGIFFEPEEKIVEKQVKRELTTTPEEFAAAEQKDTQGSREKTPGPKTAAGWRYRIKKALLDKARGVCPGCLERKDLRLYRVNKNGETPKESDYLLLCCSCIEEKQKEKKKAKLWTHKPDGETHKAPSERKGTSKQTFFNSIRELVFERDKNRCVFCEALGKKKYEEGSGVSWLGLAPLIPESKGGERCFDNYVVSCAFHRASKGDELPFNYIFEKLSFEYYLTEQLDHEPTATPGVTTRTNLHLIAEIQQYLHRIAAGEEIDRSKAERLAIKLSETDEDRKKEREQVLW